MPLFPPHPERRPAVITGASSGIGEKTARMLGEAGYPVVLGARNVGKCSQIAAEIRDSGGESFSCALDLSDETSVRQFVSEAVANVGPIEVLISNAATVWPKKAMETTVPDFTDILQVNLIGPHLLTSLIAPGMLERGRGDLLFVTSDIFRFPRPGMAAYASSKWGLEGYVRTLQMEFEGTGVRASILRPGPTRTEMGTDWDQPTTDWALTEWMKWGLLRHGALLRPEAVASAILACISADRGAHLMTVDVQPEGFMSKGDK